MKRLLYSTGLVMAAVLASLLYIAQGNPAAVLAQVAGFFSTVTVTGNNGTGSYTNQGAYISWNLSAGGGETDFLNNRGLGTGDAFEWWGPTSGGLGSPLGNMTQTGVLSTTGGFSGALAGTGGSLSGTYSGAPTFSGIVTFNGTANFSNNVNVATGTTNVFGGTFTFSGNATFSNLISGSINGNAATATALANSSPAQCSGGGATGITSIGDAVCISSTYLTQTARKGSATCSPAATSYATCSDSITWPIPFADSNYNPVCWLGAPTGGGESLTVYESSITATGVGLTIQTQTSVASSSASNIFCSATHL